jgi:hypothetical protein
MIVTKCFFFETGPLGDIEQQQQQQVVSVKVLELLDDENYPIFTWPSAIVLSAYLVHLHKSGASSLEQNTCGTPFLLSVSVVLELGAGTALPSLVCAALDVQQCIITERADQPDLLDNISKCIELNGFENNNCSVLPFSWDDGNDPVIDCLSVDVVLGADIFYSSEDFDDILYTIFRLMSRNPNLSFITSYQERK